MNTVLLFSILAMLAVIVLLMILVVDQVRGVHRAIVPELEQEPDEEPLPVKQDSTLEAEEKAKAESLADEDGPEGEPLPEENNDKPDASFGTLVGKRLWDAMTGKPLPDLDEAKVAELKPRYHILLAKHIEELFEEGRGHGESGHAHVPQNKRKIKGLRGTVVSWIPQQHADTIYQAGFDSATATDEAARQTIEHTLAESIDALCARTDLPQPDPLAGRLMALGLAANGGGSGAGEPLQIGMAPQPSPASASVGKKAGEKSKEEVPA